MFLTILGVILLALDFVIIGIVQYFSTKADKKHARQIKILQNDNKHLWEEVERIKKRV